MSHGPHGTMVSRPSIQCLAGDEAIARLEGVSRKDMNEK